MPYVVSVSSTHAQVLTRTRDTRRQVRHVGGLRTEQAVQRAVCAGAGGQVARQQREQREQQGSAGCGGVGGQGQSLRPTAGSTTVGRGQGSCSWEVQVLMCMRGFAARHRLKDTPVRVFSLHPGVIFTVGARRIASTVFIGLLDLTFSPHASCHIAPS